DRNGDGCLDAAEFARPSATRLIGDPEGFFRAVHWQRFTAHPPAVAFSTPDTDGDGRTSRAEGEAHFRKVGIAPLSIAIEPTEQIASQCTETLFRYLDADGDGRLSRQELAAARARLAPLDLDEDETLTRAELLPKSPGRVLTIGPTPGVLF